MAAAKEELQAPDGTKPMMISMREMETLGLKTGSGLRDTVPFKVFDKAVIMEQITQMGFMCPFHEYRNELSKLEGTEILIVADPHEIYGENWLLCLTRKGLEAQMNIIQQKEKEKLELEAAAASAKEEQVDYSTLVYEDKPILAKVWDSSTTKETCDQVNRLNIKSTRPLVKVSVTRWSDEFNADCKFNDRDADQCFVEWRQHKDPNYELTRMEQDIGLQGIPELIDNSTQTSWFRQVNSALQYTSLVMDSQSKQAEMDSEKLQSFLNRAVGVVEEALQQNETFDIFLDPFANLNEEEASMSNKNENNIKEIRSFTDLVYSKNKTLPAIDWHPKKNGIIAVAAAANVNFSKRLDLLDKIDSSYILIWNFVDLIHPQLMLEAPQDVMTLRFNPSQPHIIAGGLYNGQVLVWDFSKAEHHMNKKKGKDAKSGGDEGQKQIPLVKPVHVSYIDASHRRPVSDLYWLPPGMEINSRGHVATTNDTSVNQFVTIAGDGQVCFWDLRFKDPKYRGISRVKAEKTANKDASPEIHFTPIYSISLNKTDSSGELGLKSFSFEKPKEESGNNTSFTSRFYCGTEEGELVYADWRPHAAAKAVYSKDEENGNGEEGVQYVQWIHRDHFRPIITVSFSPFFPSISMTVGETSFHLWNTAQNKGAEGNSPIFISPLSLTAITCAAFSPSRPGVIYVGKADGNLEVWDFLDQSHKASLSVGVTACALTSIEFRPVVSNSNGATNSAVTAGTGASKTGTAASGNGTSNNANTNANLKQQLVAVGDQNGNLHILEIPRTLARGPSGERQAMESYFKRESERIKSRYDSAAAANTVAAGAKTNSTNNRDEPIVQPPKNNNSEKEASEDEIFKRMEMEFRKELGIEAA